MPISTFYKGKIILLTGGTGFVGKVLLEKILRCLPSVERVYLLIRQKKGSSLIERFKREVLGSQCFDRLRKIKMNEFDSFIDRVVKPVEGDMMKANLGLNETNLQEVLSTV